MTKNDPTHFGIKPLKTNIFPENQWLEDDISFWNGPFFGDIFYIFRRVCFGDTKYLWNENKDQFTWKFRDLAEFGDFSDVQKQVGKLVPK